MLSISRLNIIATSLVSCEDLQKIVLEYKCNATAHLFLSVYKDTAAIVEQMPIAMNGGCGEIDVMLPVQTESFDAVWKISDKSGNVLTQTKAYWKKPREWTLYAMVSSHTDIGLHNSQYIQRHNSSKFVDKAAVLSDQTEAYEENNKYRYTMEGTWFWNNYGMDRGKAAADRIVRDYIKKGKLGICSGLAGNHIQTYGLEEMCRSTYEKRMLEDKWNVESETLSMIDNNGLPWSMIAPYVDAGYKNIIFAPNQWNPNPSKVWKKSLVGGEIWNTNASGGGARIDVRYTSDLPMVFDWEDANGKKITVWSSTQYEWGGVAFGLYPRPKHAPFESPQDLLYYTEEKMVKQLEMLESKYPYDIWLFGCYGDDQEPNTFLLEQIIRWNKKWKWPCLRTLGDPNEPFRLLRARFKDQIPVVRGDITGGWYQHPLTVPELMSQKFEIDRALPNAEKWSETEAFPQKNRLH